MNGAGLLLEARGIGRRAPSRDGQRGDGTDAGGPWLLESVSLTLGPGERLVVEGPSGAGKTLLLRALALLDPVERGEVLWRGAPVLDRAVPAFRRQVVYLHQRPALLEGSVETNLQRPFAFDTVGGSYDRQRVTAMLARLGRGTDFLSKSVADLSGGEAQIAAMLRAMQLDPSVLLLDEPTAALDRDAVDAIERLVSQWQDGAREERAIVWVSHDGIQAGRVGDRTLRLAAGRIVA